MLDFVPMQGWVLLLLGLFAVGPARYIFDYYRHDPARRDITLPPEDLEWRTQARFWKNAALLAGAVGVAVFAFTPQAAEFAKSEAATKLLIGGIGSYAASMLFTGLKDGSITPAVRGDFGPYDRDAHPKRFWASVVWNGVLGFGLMGLSLFGDFDKRTDICDADHIEDRLQEALAACTELLAEDDLTSSERANVLGDRGRVHARLEQNQKALQDYDEALRLNPQDSYALYNRALINRAFGRHDEAVRDFRTSLALRPDNPEGELELGISLLDAGRPDEAMRQYNRYVSRNEDEPWGYANRGLLHAWQGNRAKAEADLDKAWSLDPGNYVVMRARAVLEAQTGNPQLAIGLLDTLLEKDPDDEWARGYRDFLAKEVSRLSAELESARLQPL